MDPDWKNLQRRAANLNFRSKGSMFYDDLKQESLIALWQNQDKDVSLQNSIAKRRAFDEARRLLRTRNKMQVFSYHNDVSNGSGEPYANSTTNGDTNGNRHFLKAVVYEEPAFEDVQTFSLEQILAMFDHPQHIFIAKGLAEGKAKQDIATEMGLTPGRVSQNLTQMRRIAERHRVLFCDD